MKRQLKHWIQVRLLPVIIFIFLKVLRATMLIRMVGREIPERFHREGTGIIHIFWHGRLLMAPFAYRGKGINVLISIHRDGEMIANTMKLFGFGLVRGSSKKGGEEALKEMVRLVESDQDLAITPDGPKGPVEILKPGAAQVARLTGKPIIPFAYSSTRIKRFNSWDRFMLPLPFSRGVYVYGEPLFYEEGEELESFRGRVEQALKIVTRQADELCGH